MELKQKFFFDTYALVEIAKGNPNYEIYKDATVITTTLNLMELHYVFLRTIGEEEADSRYDEHLPFVVHFGDMTIKNATRLRFALRKRNVSYIDCIGYIIAKTLDIPFLTGDKEFEHMENVEFVK